MTLNDICRKCLLDKFYNGFPEDAPEEKKAEYREKVLNEVYHDGGRTSPEIVERITKIYRALFGPEKDYSEIKSHYNRLMLSFEKMMRDAADSSPEPLLTALRYAAAANYIDFSAMDSVDEDKLHRFIAESGEIEIDPRVLSRLRAALLGAGKLTYLLDNCGEIVMDRVLMQVIARLNPGVEITAVVKGGVIVNDATQEDAEEVRLHEVVHRVVDTGLGIAGCPEGRISPECRAAMDGADLILAKGQANYETLAGCGLNLYYIFMCKCPLFTYRFQVPLYTGMLVWERDPLPER